MATLATTPPATASTPFSMRAILAPLIAIIVGIFMVVLDGTAVNVAVPSLVREFHDSLATLQWTITGYALAQAAVIPLAGWLSDRFGAKNLFLVSIALFTIGSVLCSTAQTSGMLIAFRVLQGLGGGFVLPVGMAYTYRLAPPERVGAVMGLMGIPILFAPAIGPVLAGWLVQYASWRWLFLINFPIGIIGVLIGIRSLPVLERQQNVEALDIWGVILAPLAFASLVYGISEGSTSWTSANTIAGIVVGVVALVLFVVVELRVKYPLLELRVFQSPDFVVSIIAQWVGQFALFGTLFMVPLFLQTVRGYGAFDTGLTLLPQAIGAAIFMPLGGILFDKIGARPLVVVGGAIMAGASFMLATVDTHTQGRDLILPLFMYGTGMGLTLMSLNTQLINSAPRRLVGRVTSLTNALQQVISALTVAALSTYLTSRGSYHTAQGLLAQVQAAAAKAPHAAGAVATQLPPQVQALITHAYVLLAQAFDDAFRLMGFVAIVGAALGFALRRVTAAQAAAAAEGEGQAAAAPVAHMMA